MKMLTSTLLLIVAVTGCAKMKEKMGEMKDNVQKSTSNAQAKYDSEVNRRMNPDGTPVQDPGPPSGEAGDAGAQNAVAGGAAATTASQGASSQGSEGSASSGVGSDTGASGSEAGVGSEGVSLSGGEGSGTDASASFAAGGYVPDCSKPNNAPEQVDATGTERWQWTDAQKGAFMRYRMTSDMEMTYDVKDATDKLVLVETRTTMGGKLLSCSLDWQPRLFKKVEIAETEKVDYETKTTDLPDEVVDVGGKSVNCKVRRVWTKFAGGESTSVIWTSTEVPGETVKTATETEKGLETVYQLMEWRS